MKEKVIKILIGIIKRIFYVMVLPSIMFALLIAVLYDPDILDQMYESIIA